MLVKLPLNTPEVAIGAKTAVVVHVPFGWHLEHIAHNLHDVCMLSGLYPGLYGIDHTPTL